MKICNHASIGVLITMLFSPFAEAWTNDLRITSIQRTNECTTLAWVSHPGEFYTVYWTDEMRANPFWRVAAILLPSGGTNTIWSDCESSESMMMAGQSGGLQLNEVESVMTYEEALAAYEANREAREATIEYLEALLSDAIARASTNQPSQNVLTLGQGAQMNFSAPPPPEGGGGTWTNIPPEYRFYRVARVAVTGFVDGWGSGMGSPPSDLTNVIMVSAGPHDSGSHNLALLADGNVRAWGNNAYGQCVVPSNVTDAVSISAGGRHSAAVRRDGTVAVWGDNRLGQITNAPTSLTNVIDVKAGLWHTLALHSDGRVSAWGDMYIRTNAVPAGLTNVIGIAAGARHCLALKSDHTLVAWGFDHSFLGNYLPTNVPSSLTNVVAISAGMEHNQALLRDSTVVVWGKTNNAGMEVPPGLTNVLGISAGWHRGLAWDSSAVPISWGQSQSPAGLASVVAGSGNGLHSIIIRTNHSGIIIRRQPRDLTAPRGTSTNIWVEATSDLALSYQWQKNGTNLLGRTNSVLSFPDLQDVDDGYYRVRLSTSSSEIWSREAFVQTIHPPVITNQIPSLSIQQPQFTVVPLGVQVYSKGSSNLRYAWYHDSVPLGMGGLTSIYSLLLKGTADEGPYWVVVRNEAGSVTSQVWQVSVSLNGEFAGWGNNDYEQVTGIRYETNLIQISAGELHNLALREEGTVLGWGDDFYGAATVPSGLSNVVAVSAGSAHSLALKKDGTISGWGSNTYGQRQAPADATNLIGIAAGKYHSLGLRNSGTVVAWGDNSWGATNVPAGLTNVMQLAGGDGLSYALLSNGTVRAWGSGGLGAITVPSNLSNVVEIAAGYTHLLALKENGTVVCLGQDSGWGETTPPSGLSNVWHVAAGYSFSVALLNDTSIRTWGRDDHGQATIPYGMRNMKQVSAGGWHALALAYNPVLMYPVDVNRDVLLLFNTNSANSIAVKDYYLANRPGVARANVLGLGCQDVEVISRQDFTNSIGNPVLQWQQQNPTKKPEYMVFFLGIPSRTLFTGDILPPSTSYHLRQWFPYQKPFITHINMGASGTNDCIGYVSKVKEFGDTYSPGKLHIRPSSGAYGGTNYYFDDAQPVAQYTNFFAARDYRDAVLAAGVSASAITYVDARPAVPQPEDHILLATNVAGYVTWGYNACMGSQYAIEPEYVSRCGWVFPNVVFLGDSGWYLIHTIESFNGWRQSHQGNFIDWFSSNAFGGTGYSNTPVCAASHVEEPEAGHYRPEFFGLWVKGKSFAKAVWLSNRTTHLQAIGDPFVAR